MDNARDLLDIETYATSQLYETPYSDITLKYWVFFERNLDEYLKDLLTIERLSARIDELKTYHKDCGMFHESNEHVPLTIEERIDSLQTELNKYKEDLIK